MWWTRLPLGIGPIPVPGTDVKATPGLATRTTRTDSTSALDEKKNDARRCHRRSRPPGVRSTAIL